jgi:hypothetical protein
MVKEKKPKKTFRTGPASGYVAIASHDKTGVARLIRQDGADLSIDAKAGTLFPTKATANNAVKKFIVNNPGYTYFVEALGQRTTDFV